MNDSKENFCKLFDIQKWIPEFSIGKFIQYFFLVNKNKIIFIHLDKTNFNYKNHCKDASKIIKCIVFRNGMKNLYITYILYIIIVLYYISKIVFT